MELTPELIERLKTNEKAFHFLDEEMKEAFRRLNNNMSNPIILIGYDGEWKKPPSCAPIWDLNPNLTYRLSPDYQPEPEDPYVLYEIKYPKENEVAHAYFECPKTLSIHGSALLSEAVNLKGFIGGRYEYASEKMICVGRVGPLLVLNDNHNSLGFQAMPENKFRKDLINNEYEIIYPTHVVFQKGSE